MTLGRRGGGFLENMKCKEGQQHIWNGQQKTTNCLAIPQGQPNVIPVYDPKKGLEGSNNPYVF